MPTYQDIDLFDRKTAQGDIITYYDSDAIKMALTLWITSKRGEFLKQPTYGGVLDFQIMKNMDEGHLNKLIFDIQTQIENEFSPEITLQSLNITPDYTRKILQIDLEYIETLTQEYQTLTIYTRDLSNKPSFTFVEVAETGLNLRNWVIINKPSMGKTLLIFDMDQGVWRWGKYLLTNFSATDPYFEAILTLINLS